MIYIHEIATLARSNREHWCCEYVITYHTVNGVSDRDLIIGVIQ
jgi:hypothetical protein